MLVLRTAIRSRLGFNAIAIPTRSCRPIPRRPYHRFVQQYTWPARLRYRLDGTPRSKWKGALSVVAVFSLYTIWKAMKELGRQVVNLTFLFHLQRLDTKYSNYDFSNALHVQAYIGELLNCIQLDFKQETIDQFKLGIALSMKESPELHTYLRERLEEIHSVVAQSDKKPMEIAKESQEIIVSIMKRVVEILGTITESAIGSKVQKSGEGDTYIVVG